MAAYRSIFDTADWIAALDRQIAAPPEAPPAAKVEPEIAAQPAQAVAPVRARYKRVRNWQIAVAYGLIHIGLLTTIMGLAGAPLLVVGLSLLMHTVVLLLTIAVGAALNRRRFAA